MFFEGFSFQRSQLQVDCLGVKQPSRFSLFFAHVTDLILCVSYINNPRIHHAPFMFVSKATCTVNPGILCIVMNIIFSPLFSLKSISLSNFLFLTFHTMISYLVCPLIIPQNQPLHICIVDSIRGQLCIVICRSKMERRRKLLKFKFQNSKFLNIFTASKSVHGTSLTGWIITIHNWGFCFSS